MSKRGNYAKQSICWDCGNAYPTKCEWFREQKKIWNDATSKNIRIKESQYITIYSVQDCDNFIPDSDETRLKLEAWHDHSTLKTNGRLLI